MTDAPKHIWAWHFLGEMQQPEIKGGWTDEPDARDMIRETKYIRSDIAAARDAKLVDLVAEVLREMDAFTGGGQPTGDAIDWANRARALLSELEAK